MTKMKLLLSMNYRFEFFVNLAIQAILLFTTAFFWKAAYKGIVSVQSVNEQQMLTYSVMAIILGIIFNPSVESNIKSKVRRGNIAVDYIKPANVFLMYFSEDVGIAMTNLIQRVIPIFVCSCLFIIVPTAASAMHFILFLLSSCLSYFILWFISAIIGLFYFKVIDMGPIGIIKDYLIKILSGSFVPIWLFSSSLQVVLQFLPFIYTYQLPLSIFIGKVTINEALEGMFIQVVWVSLFFLLFLKLKNKMEKNIFVQGG